jgi:hypothetical protein
METTQMPDIDKTTLLRRTGALAAGAVITTTAHAAPVASPGAGGDDAELGKSKPPGNVVSLAAYRRSPVVAAPTEPDPHFMEKAQLVADYATAIGVDLRLAAAVQRGDIPPDPKPGPS